MLLIVVGTTRGRPGGAMLRIDATAPTGGVIDPVAGLFCKGS
jgi:hypothetical protein